MDHFTIFFRPWPNGKIATKYSLLCSMGERAKKGGPMCVGPALSASVKSRPLKRPARRGEKTGLQRKVLRREAGQLGGALWNTAQRVVPVLSALRHLAHRPLFFTVEAAGLRGFAPEFTVFAAGADCGAEQRLFKHSACSSSFAFFLLYQSRPSASTVFRCARCAAGRWPAYTCRIRRTLHLRACAR